MYVARNTNMDGAENVAPLAQYLPPTTRFDWSQGLKVKD